MRPIGASKCCPLTRREAFRAKGSAADPLLQSDDRVIVFSRQPDRGAALADVLQEMRLQTRDNNPMPVVSINGRVRAPGEYPLERKHDSGGSHPRRRRPRRRGVRDDAELTRYEVVNGESRKTEVHRARSRERRRAGRRFVQLASTDMPLRAYDVLVIKETPDWREQESITLRGEVRFPGAYPIRKGETLSSVIERAGGLTEDAFPKAVSSCARSSRTQERQQIERLANRLQSDLTLVALQSAQTQKESSAEALAAGQSLLAQLRSAQAHRPAGHRSGARMARKAVRTTSSCAAATNSSYRGMKPYVTVIGEVQNATSHVWKNGMGRDEYIQLSGGTTPRADDKRIYVVRADGSVVASSDKRLVWRRRKRRSRTRRHDRRADRCRAHAAAAALDCGDDDYLQPGDRSGGGQFILIGLGAQLRSDVSRFTKEQSS